MDNGYNKDEIEEILKRYMGDSGASGDSPKTAAEKPIEKTTDKAVEKPIDEPIEIIMDEPEEKPAERSVEKPAEKSVDRKSEEKAEEPEEEPAEKKEEKPVSKLAIKGVNRTGAGVVSGAPGSVLAKSSKVKVSRAELMKRQAEEQDAKNEKETEKEASKTVNSKPSNSKSAKTKPKTDSKKNTKTKDTKKKKKAKTKKDLILNILLVIFIATFLISGGYLGMYYYNIHKAQKSFDSLKGMIKDSPGGDELTVGTDTDATGLTYVDINGVKVQEKFADLYTANNDFIGWLTIPGTEVDYPVMHTPSDEEFYLKRDFNKEKSSSGTLFIAAKCDALLPSDNVVIYGHNMKAGTMFHDLLKYETEDYYKEHKTFRFDTLLGNYEYEVIAAFRTEIKRDDNTFKYYDFINAKDKDEFDEYVSKVKSKTPYTIDETAEYGDKLVTLSTCAYHANEGRYVVVAKMKKVEK